MAGQNNIIPARSTAYTFTKTINTLFSVICSRTKINYIFPFPILITFTPFNLTWLDKAITFSGLSRFCGSFAELFYIFRVPIKIFISPSYFTLNIIKTPFAEGIRSAFGTEGYQVGFEAAGVQASLDALIANVEKGGEVIILGVFSRNPIVNMYFVGEHELNLYGSMMYRHEDYLEAVKLISEGKIILDPLISKHFPFEKYHEAYQYIEESEDKVMKVMVDL